MQEIIKKLTNIYFSKLEAQIYIELLKEPGQTVYQLAKTINVARSSVYPTVENMYHQGYILLMSGSPAKYFPENPHTLFKKLADSYLHSAQELEDALSRFQEENQVEYFINIKGEESNLAKAKELLLKSEKEVYLNTDYNLTIFDKELAILEKRGVRVIYFSFGARHYKRSNIETYVHQVPIDDNHKPTRIMLVSDYKEVLVASSNKHNADWIGTITNNELMVKIMSEHIHHDIYISKILEQSQVDYFDENGSNSVLLHTLSENKLS